MHLWRSWLELWTPYGGKRRPVRGACSARNRAPPRPPTRWGAVLAGSGRARRLSATSTRSLWARTDSAAGRPYTQRGTGATHGRLALGRCSSGSRRGASGAPFLGPRPGKVARVAATSPAGTSEVTGPTLDRPHAHVREEGQPTRAVSPEVTCGRRSDLPGPTGTDDRRAVVLSRLRPGPPRQTDGPQ